MEKAVAIRNSQFSPTDKEYNSTEAKRKRGDKGIRWHTDSLQRASIRVVLTNYEDTCEH